MALTSDFKYSRRKTSWPHVHGFLRRLVYSEKKQSLIGKQNFLMKLPERGKCVQYKVVLIWFWILKSSFSSKYTFSSHPLTQFMTQQNVCGREQSSALSGYKYEIAVSAVQHCVQKKFKKAISRWNAERCFVKLGQKCIFLIPPNVVGRRAALLVLFREKDVWRKT